MSDTKHFTYVDAGETNKQAGPQRMVNYKSPIPKTKLTRALLTDNVCGEYKQWEFSQKNCITIG